jgi:hypothetical protein
MRGTRHLLRGGKALSGAPARELGDLQGLRSAESRLAVGCLPRSGQSAAPRPRWRGQCPVAAMTRVPLAGAEAYEWSALRRVRDSGVAKAGERWVDSGHRRPGYLLAPSLVARQ